MALLAEPALGVERGGAAGASRRDRLPVHVVLHVSRGEDTRDVGLGRLPPGQQVAAVRLVIELIEEQRRVRVVPDGDEHAVGGELGFVTRDGVAQPDAGHLVVAEHLTDDLVEDELDLLVRARPVDHDRRRAELLPPVDDDDPAREAGDEQRLLHRRVATADDDHDLVPEERRIAGRAVRDAASLQQPLGLEPELARARAGGDDHRLRPVLVVADPHAKGPLGEVHARDVVGDERRPEPLGLAAEVLHHRRPHDAVGVARVVLDVGRDHQLAAPVEPLDHERIEVGSGGVERSGVPRGSTADHDDVAHVGHGRPVLLGWSMTPL